MGIIINGQNGTIGPVDNTMSLLGTVSIGGTMTIEDFTNIDSVGLVTARNGLHVTGGNLGIGINNPTRLLHLHESSSSGTFLSFTNTTTGSSISDGALIGIQDDESLLISNKENNFVTIHTNNTERLRITSGGNLQVKGGNLHLDSNAELALFEDNTSGSYTNSAKIAFDFSGNIARMRSSTNGSATIKPLAFYIANTPAIFIGTDGKVGINETSPTGRLEVKSTGATAVFNSGAANDGRLEFEYNSSRVGLLAYHSDRLEIQTDSSKDFTIRTNGANERLRITSAGLVGIGIDVPQGELHVKRTSGTGRIILEGSSLAQIGLRDNAGGTDSKVIQIRNNAQNLLIGTQTDSYQSFSEKVRITSAGEVRQQSTGGSTIYELKRSDANTTGAVGTINYTASDGHSVASMSAIGDGDNEGAHLVFRTTSAAANNSPYNAATPERLRITSAGGVTIGSGNNDSSMSEFGSNTGGLTIDDAGVSNTGIRLSHGNDDTYLVQSSNSNFYISQYGAGDMIFGVGSSGNERLRITSDGKLGHGTASPSSVFHSTVSSGGYNAIFESTANGGESVVTLKGKLSDGTVRTAIFKYDNADMIRLGTSQSIPLRFETSDTERLRITADGKIGINASSGFNAYGDVLLVQANTGATAKSMISVRGGATGYVHSALKLSATTHSNSGGNQRGLGVFMHDESSNVEWYAGRPYAQSDYFLVARNTAVSNANAGGVTAQHSRRMWQVDSSGRTVQNGGIYTYQPGQTSGAKTSRAFEAKGASGTYSTCVIELDQHSYGSVAWDIKVGGYHSAHQHVAGTYYCNGNLYANYTSINNSANVNYTRTWVSGQIVRHTFNYNNGFVHPTCEVTATCGGDGYLGPGDITITWS